MDWFNLFFVAFLASTIRIACPILFAALGENISEKAGVLNVGLEGMIMAGAFAGYATMFFTGNLLISLLGGILAGALCGLAHAFISITLKQNQMVSGLAINIIMIGLTSYLNRVLFGVYLVPKAITPMQSWKIPVLGDIPVIGTILFNHIPLVYISILLVPIIHVLLNYTSIGLKIRSVGEHPLAADTLGINLKRVRYYCVLFCGMMAGLGGTFLSLGNMNIFLDEMSAGRGYIALAAVIFGKWKPFGVLGAVLFFSGAEALLTRLQAVGSNIPVEYLGMLPYLATVIALAFTAKKGSGPAALGQPYWR